ncbi:MAG: hypothetical protein WA766_19370, partial [Candidatus Acidiferrales bacterium]
PRAASFFWRTASSMIFIALQRLHDGIFVEQLPIIRWASVPPHNRTGRAAHRIWSTNAGKDFVIEIRGLD